MQGLGLDSNDMYNTMSTLNQTEKVIGSQWLPQAVGKIGYSVEDKFLMACEMEEKLMAVLDTYTIPYMADSECMGGLL